jgi:hypothetical protein
MLCRLSFFQRFFPCCGHLHLDFKFKRFMCACMIVRADPETPSFDDGNHTTFTLKDSFRKTNFPYHYYLLSALRR